MLPAWLVIALVFLRPALEASAFIGFGFPGEVAVILGGVAALCCYWRDGPGLAVGRGAQNDHLGGCTAERSSPAAQNEPPAGGARRRSAGY